jgi:ribonucleotide monophosphatase NagD (HAD superfamily)
LRVSKAYVVGHSGIVEELSAVGIESIGAEDHADHHDMDTLRQWKPDPDVGAVVIGMDYNINYRKLTYAQVRTRGIYQPVGMSGAYV